MDCAKKDASEFPFLEGSVLQLVEHDLLGRERGAVLGIADLVELADVEPGRENLEGRHGLLVGERRFKGDPVWTI